MSQRPDIDHNVLMETNHQLPDGSWISLRVENNSLHSQWSCFWLTFVVGKVRPAWYRVFAVGTQPPDWKPMQLAEAVDKKTDPEYEDEDPEETQRQNEGKVGAARKLSKGRYVFQAKVRADGEDVELGSIEFEVFRGTHGAGWG